MTAKRLFALLLFLVLFGCASSNSREAIPSNSLFAKVKVEMAETQVQDLIGNPTDTVDRITGNMLNPFYMGPDIGRIVWFYKGEGRLEFDGDGRLVEIIYDPSEDGYK